LTADFLNPIVKGWCTETGVVVASAGVQVHGGMGFIEETGAAQYYRDVRITPIYEGTTAIQANDLVNRKILRDQGAVARQVLAEVARNAATLRQAADGTLAAIGAAMAEAESAASQSVAWLLTAGAQDPRLPAAAAVPLLMLLGTVLGGHQMARAAAIAQQRLSDGAGDRAPLRPACAAGSAGAGAHCHARLAYRDGAARRAALSRILSTGSVAFRRPLPHRRQGQHGVDIGAAGRLQGDAIALQAEDDRRIHGVGQAPAAEHEIPAGAETLPAFLPQRFDAGDVGGGGGRRHEIGDGGTDRHRQMLAQGGKAGMHFRRNGTGHCASGAVLRPQGIGAGKFGDIFADRQAVPNLQAAMAQQRDLAGR